MIKRFISLIFFMCLIFFKQECSAKELSGLNALVTGGSRGIGEACCHVLAREGANIAIIVSQSIEEAKDVAEKIEMDYGVSAYAVKCDVSNPVEVNRVVAEMIERWGAIDILVNNAGIAQHVPAEEMSFEEWQRMIDVNLTGPFICAQAAGKKMIELGMSGSIINISSICGHIVVVPQKQCHYNAAKGGLAMLSKSLAVEWVDYGIRVNTISPGYIATKLLGPACALHEKWIERSPMKKMGTPEDIAEAVLYLASPKSKFVTGSDWIIDGGYTCP